ncbi:MAG: D-2-hydroxyacid dehydrogenase [Schwartzia sp.]|nr:D-2-hydroxyacid dehydrogenase [Schwartzia sp. (in: firmicutes)]
MKILVVMNTRPHHRDWLAASAPGKEITYRSVDRLSEDDVREAEVVIGNLPPRLLPAATRLRWLQLNTAGADAYCQPGVLPPGTVLTNATGAYGLALSEHMLGQLLAMMKKLYLYYDNQRRCLWRDEGPVTSVAGAVVLIVGLGDVGTAFARLVKAMGAHVIGIRRRPSAPPPEVDEMAPIEQLDGCLARADIVAAALPGTPATRHLFDAGRFAAMKEHAYFLNIGRGFSVVSEDLAAAVGSGHLAGAAVDVTEPEPLPPDHPLWKVPNLYITPHISGQNHLAATTDNIVRIAAGNLANYLAGHPLRNEVDFATGYRK